jgi:hypothetical protein
MNLCRRRTGCESIPRRTGDWHWKYILRYRLRDEHIAIFHKSYSGPKRAAWRASSTLHIFAARRSLINYKTAVPLNPALLDENLRAYVLLLSAHFQGFCRDLYTECAQMKTIITILAVPIFLLVAVSPCFALWGIAPVDKQRAKELDMEVRSEAAGPNQVRVELDFNAERELKNFSRVDLRLGEGDNPLLTAPLQEDRSKPRRVAVNFTAERAHLDKITLRVMVPEKLGGTAYQLRMKDFVKPEKGR